MCYCCSKFASARSENKCVTFIIEAFLCYIVLLEYMRQHSSVASKLLNGDRLSEHSCCMVFGDVSPWPSP